MERYNTAHLFPLIANTSISLTEAAVSQELKYDSYLNESP